MTSCMARVIVRRAPAFSPCDRVDNGCMSRIAIALAALALGCTGDVVGGAAVDAATNPQIDAPASTIDAPAGDGAAQPDAAMGRDFSTDRTRFFGASRCAQAN